VSAYLDASALVPLRVVTETSSATMDAFVDDYDGGLQRHAPWRSM